MRGTGRCHLSWSYSAFGAAAQDRYPSRSIKFVVPFVAGSATDTLARLLGNRVSQSLGQTVVVENIGGGSGIPAAQNVVRSAPDGYTVFITSNTTHASNQSMLKRVPYDAVADFEPITQARHHHAGLGRPSLGSRQQRAGAYRLRQGQSRQADVRLRLDLVARGRRADEDHGRHRHAARALSQQSAGGDRSARRTDHRCSSATFRRRCRRCGPAS